MAQGPGGIAGPQLVCVEAIWCGTAQFGSADCDEGCFCGDAGGFVIKKDTPNPKAPHNEWFCSNLALKVGVPQIGFDIVKHVDGNYWFGSSWKEGKVRDWWKLAQAGKIDFALLAADISRIYAFDLFIHNSDRHADNYFVVPDGGTHRVFSLDYGRSWLYHGFPPPAIMQDPALNTVSTKNWFKANFPNYFDVVAATSVLDELGKVTAQQAEEIILKQPNNWLQQQEISAILTWWNADAPARVDAIRNGIGNGSLI